jgi:hypothetical protein
MSDQSHGFVLCPDDFRYEIDSEKSKLTALLSSSSDVVQWNLEVEALDNPDYEDLELAPQCAPVARVSFELPELRAWRALAGRHISLDYRKYLDDEWCDNDIAGLYLGYHIFPIFHEIDFGKRTGKYFPLKWHLEGSEEPELYFECDSEPTLNVHPYEIEAIVPFQHVIISFPGVPQALRHQYGEFERIERLEP